MFTFFKGSLQNYDFEFKAWPVNFRWDESSIKSEITNPTPASDFPDNQSFFGKILSFPISIVE